MIYTFGNCCLDTDQCVLHRAGKQIPLRPKAYWILIHLLKNPNRVVSKQELCEAVWNGRCISNTTIESTVLAARRAVGDSGQTQKIIKTFPLHGYRLVTLVEMSQVPDETDGTHAGSRFASTDTSTKAAEKSASHDDSSSVILVEQPVLPMTPTTMDCMPEAQQRHISVMFCGLRHTPMDGKATDPEKLVDAMRKAQDVCISIFQQNKGYITQKLRNGLWVYFGYPEFQKDAAYRAVKSSLNIINTLRSLNHSIDSEQRIPLVVKIGIHTGLVTDAVKPNGCHEQLSLGNTPSIAARLMTIGAPDAIMISGATARQLKGYFVYQDLGEHTLEDIAKPIRVYRVRYASHPSVSTILTS